MPVVDFTNNAILPANARASDVAEKAVEEILPTQHRKYLSAFRVQGIEAVLYHRLTQGRKCSCNAAGKQVSSRLDQNGKADQGTINELLSGAREFTVSAYGQDDRRRLFNNSDDESPFAPVNKHQGVFDIVTDEDIPFQREAEGLDFGDNGPFNPETLDDMAGEYDVGVTGLLDAACPVCFGTGFIGGYDANRAYRNVITAMDVELHQGELDLLQTPFAATATYFEVATLLPAGAILVDSFTLWNGAEQVGFKLFIDETPIQRQQDILKFCDGRQHLVRVVPYNTKSITFTHLEIQFGLSTESMYFEFPKMTYSSETALLEQLNPFTIIVSPDIPMIRHMDIIKDCMTGKTLIVKNVNDWNTRNRQVLGWEAEVRVLQPQELPCILPHRRPQMTKNATSRMVLDNQTGPRRT